MDVIRFDGEQLALNQPEPFAIGLSRSVTLQPNDLTHVATAFPGRRRTISIGDGLERPWLRCDSPFGGCATSIGTGC
jgi:hypothetical protein